MSVLVGRTALVIPRRLVRVGAEADDGVSLALGWPDLGAPPATSPPGVEPSARVLALITPAEAGPDPSARTLDLYARFFEAESWSNPGGLVLRRFKANSPYKDEELFFTPPDGRVFAARCPRQGAALDIGVQSCIWLFRIEGLDVQARFSPDLLGSWAELQEKLTDRLRVWRQPAAHAPG